MDCAMELQLCGNFQVSDIHLSIYLYFSLCVMYKSAEAWWRQKHPPLQQRWLLPQLWWRLCCDVCCWKMKDVAESHRSAVFQVTSAATVFFPPGSSIDQQGSVLVCPRTREYFYLPFSCVLLQYWLSTFMHQWLDTLDTKEIYSQVLDHLPDLQLLTSDNFEVRRK